ncbi:hypothetical protein [Promicromonospora sp. NPDC023987]|uniref:hypothetical protein n=1 Tax=Promicromonospora sp. NPDC023987 TaxID=3155360 RepID=UPI003403E0FC
MKTPLKEPHRTTPVQGREIGAQIAGAFGLVFVWINSTALPLAVRVPLLVAAGIALAAILLLSVRSYRQQADREGSARAGTDQSTARASGSPFGRKYWLVVGIEAIALFGGSQIIIGLGYPELGIAWVAFVVGTHFFPLARIFRLARFHVLGAIITAFGIAGFTIRAFGHVEPIAVVSGVLSGLALLGFGLWAFAPAPAAPHPAPESSARSPRART